jgi:hypothetical protein
MLTILYTNLSGVTNHLSTEKNINGLYEFTLPEKNFVFGILKDGKNCGSSKLTHLESFFCNGTRNYLDLNNSDFLSEGRVLLFSDSDFFFFKLDTAFSRDESMVALSASGNSQLEIFPKINGYLNYLKIAINGFQMNSININMPEIFGDFKLEIMFDLDHHYKQFTFKNIDHPSTLLTIPYKAITNLNDTAMTNENNRFENWSLMNGYRKLYILEVYQAQFSTYKTLNYKFIEGAEYNTI